MTPNYPIASHVSQWNLPWYVPQHASTSSFGTPPLDLRPLEEKYPLEYHDISVSLKGSWRWLYLGYGCHKSDSIICKIFNWVFGYHKDEPYEDSVVKVPERDLKDIDTFSGGIPDMLCDESIYQTNAFEHFMNYSVGEPDDRIAQRNYVVLLDAPEPTPVSWESTDHNPIFAMRISVDNVISFRNYTFSNGTQEYYRENARCLVNTLNTFDSTAQVYTTYNNMTAMSYSGYPFLGDCIQKGYDYCIPYFCDPRLRNRREVDYYTYNNDGDERFLLIDYWGGWSTRLRIHFFSYTDGRIAHQPYNRSFNYLGGIWNQQCYNLIYDLFTEMIFSGNCWNHNKWGIAPRINELTCYDKAHYPTEPPLTTTTTMPTTSVVATNAYSFIERWGMDLIFSSVFFLNFVTFVGYIIIDCGKRSLIKTINIETV